jgi:hypothetical protein
VVNIRLDQKMDVIGVDLQPCMTYGVAHQFGDGDPRAIRSTVEHRGRDRVVQRGSG